MKSNNLYLLMDYIIAITMSEEEIGLIGYVEIKHIRNGKVIDIRKGKNLITNVGLAQFAGLINGVVTTPFTYIAIGIGTTAPSVTDTALASETHRSSAIASRVTTDVTDDTAQLVATFSFTASYAITESGVFDAKTAGNMACRQTFAALNVVSGDSLQVTWNCNSES